MRASPARNILDPSAATGPAGNTLVSEGRMFSGARISRESVPVCSMVSVPADENSTESKPCTSLVAVWAGPELVALTLPQPPISTTRMTAANATRKVRMFDRRASLVRPIMPPIRGPGGRAERRDGREPACARPNRPGTKHDPKSGRIRPWARTRLAEIIRAIHADALSSTVKLNVDLDIMLYVLAQALLAALRARLPGYTDVTPDVLQRRFLETPGQIITTPECDHRAARPARLHPVLPQAALLDTAVPWWGNRTLRYMSPDPLREPCRGNPR